MSYSPTKYLRLYSCPDLEKKSDFTLIMRDNRSGEDVSFELQQLWEGNCLFENSEWRSVTVISGDYQSP